MTDAELRALPHVNCVLAAKYLEIDPEVLRCGVEQGRIPVGYVGRGKGGRRTNMWVNVEALIKYKHGELDTALLLMFEMLNDRIKRLEERIA